MTRNALNVRGKMQIEWLGSGKKGMRGTVASVSAPEEEKTGTSHVLPLGWPNAQVGKMGAGAESNSHVEGWLCLIYE